MCKNGTLKDVLVINPSQNRKQVKVDACIAEEVQQLNNEGIVTLGCCCGHGEAGKIVEIKNASGTFKEYLQPPSTLLEERSVRKAKTLGYKPFPYFYKDGTHQHVWQMFLKTGCVTKDDCDQWHDGTWY